MFLRKIIILILIFMFKRNISIEEEYKNLIDKIFEQDECSRFIVRQLYRWFVNSEISSEIESNIIEPLALIVRENNYDIVPALKTLFTSQHF